MEDCQWTVRGLNVRLKGFLEQVNRLQEANQQLEGQIADWGIRNCSHSQEWSQQERTVKELRSQVAKMLVENSQLALQSDNTMSRAAHIQARCKLEERQTKRLEQQVALLRQSKKMAEHTNAALEADLHHSMREAQEIHRAASEAALQQQQQHHRAVWSDALLVTARASREEKEEDGTGMEFTQLPDPIRTQRSPLAPPGPRQPPPQPRLPSSGAFSNPVPGSAEPSGLGARETRAAAAVNEGAFAEEEAAWAQVGLGRAALREARAELVEARKQWNSLQVEMETLHALEKGLEHTLQQTQMMYSSKLLDLSQVIARLENELGQVRDGLVSQQQRHRHLLNTKMRLEHEIATYRRLLECEEGRYLGHDRQVLRLQPWRTSVVHPKENGLEDSFSDPALTPDEPKSEPLPDIPPLLPSDNGYVKTSKLHRQQSLVILTEPEDDSELRISTVKTQEFLQGNVVRESAEGHGTVETENIDKAIKQWEGSFFRGNPKLRKKSVSLRFDLHMAAADEGCAQTKQDSLPDVEVRLVMKRSRSIPTIT